MKTPIKFLLVLFVVIFLHSKVNATSQVAEVIIINGQKFEMLTLPIQYDSLLYFEFVKHIPDTIESTGCWRNYIGEWEIKGDKLYLNRVTDVYEAIIDTKSTFDKYKTEDGILASWFTGELRVVEGRSIFDGARLGFMRYHGVETFYKVENGNIVSKRVTKNEFRKAPISMIESLPKIREKFDMTKFPELDDASVFAFFTCLINPDGTFNRFGDGAQIIVSKGDTKSSISDNEHPYMKELIMAFKAIPQWDVLIVDGVPVKSLFTTLMIKSRKL